MLCFVLFVSNRVLVVQVIKGIPNAKAIQLDITNHESLSSCIAQVLSFDCLLCETKSGSSKDILCFEASVILNIVLELGSTG